MSFWSPLLHSVGETRTLYPLSQVLLPPSVGAELMRQDAPKNGAQLFEIASSSGQTHAGLSAVLTDVAFCDVCIAVSLLSPG